MNSARETAAEAELICSTPLCSHQIISQHGRERESEREREGLNVPRPRPADDAEGAERVFV